VPASVSTARAGGYFCSTASAYAALAVGADADNRICILSLGNGNAYSARPAGWMTLRLNSRVTGTAVVGMFRAQLGRCSIIWHTYAL